MYKQYNMNFIDANICMTRQTMQEQQLCIHKIVNGIYSAVSCIYNTVIDIYEMGNGKTDT